MNKFDKVMMETAVAWSNESYCERGKVGAVLSKDGRILATGYNGTISGMKNKCENEYLIPDKNEPTVDSMYPLICDKCSTLYNTNSINEIDDDKHDYGYYLKCTCGNTRVLKFKPSVIKKTSDFTLHAEQNLITFCAKNGIPTNECTIYITKSPCKQCSKLIASSGIKEVIYLEEYRDNDGIKFLKDVGIDVRKY